ncbi:MAG: hypothetical protein M1814_004807 [Vezdaea aestivalis]|nr:MAG: hypothetical protein M1814_004807 [Vezdaea aestivalis]
MATVAIDVPSLQRVEHDSYPISVAQFPGVKTPTYAQDNSRIVQNWFSKLEMVDWKGPDSLVQAKELFWSEPPGFWRDHLGLSWDFRCLKGPKAISSFFANSESGCRIEQYALDESSPLRIPTTTPMDGSGRITCVQAFFTFASNVGHGRGIVRLGHDQDDRWKAFTLYTKLEALLDHAEKTLSNRPLGVDHGSNPGRKNWQERRTQEQKFDDGIEPVVLIIGCGQGGLCCAARLKQLGIEALIIDQSERVGDNWRKRYHQLVLHDPVWYDHLPYLPFPPNWPIFTPKDKLGDWFENYVNIMELNVWTRTSVKSSEWSEGSKSWTVELSCEIDGITKARIVKPKHIVQATGHSGEPKIPSHIKGFDKFEGDVIVHSSKHKGAQKDGKGKNAIVVGCCNSGHDIAQDFYENGYEVTMVQRSSTSVMTSKSVMNYLLAPIYVEGGPPTEDADLIVMSFPNPVLAALHQTATKASNKDDKTLRDGLLAAGFALDDGPSSCGLFMKYFSRGGGYYIDVGCSQLIADRKITVKQGYEISKINPHSVTFTDGEELPADEIVFATGYGNMREAAKGIVGEEIAGKLKSVWGLDEESELRTVWRRSGHEGYWFFGGNLALSRYFSKLLALQILAVETGKMPRE